MTDHCSGHPVHLSSFPTPAAGHKSAAVSVEGLPLPCPCECVRYHDADSTVLVWSLRLSPSAPSQQAELKAAATYSILLCGGQSSENSSHVTKQGATEQDDATELLRRIALPLQGQTKTRTHTQAHTRQAHGNKHGRNIWHLQAFKSGHKTRGAPLCRNILERGWAWLNFA